MCGVLVAMAALPVRALAEFARPEKAMAATSLDETMKLLGEAIDSTDVILESPDIAENGSVVPVAVSSRLPDTTRIYIVLEKNPNPLAAAYMIPDGTVPYVQSRVKVAQTGLVYGVVEAGGKLYKTSRETKVTLGGCGG